VKVANRRQTVSFPEGLAPDPHRVEIRLLERRHEQASGNEFGVSGLGAAGSGH
jgi:hypothetical protein